MNKKRLIITVLILLAAIKAYGYGNGDFQIWNTNGQDIKIGKGTKFTMEEEFHFGKNAREFFYQHYDWGAAYAFDKRLELALGYKLVLEKAKHKWMESDEPYTSITARADIWKFQFEDRNRIEYRHFRFADDQIRYRNRSVLKYPFNFKTITITPYTSDEIFISSNGRGFNQNRFQSGFEFVLTKYVKADISYMLHSVRGQGNKWNTANVLWFRTKIMF